MSGNRESIFGRVAIGIGKIQKNARLTQKTWSNFVKNNLEITKTLFKFVVENDCLTNKEKGYGKDRRKKKIR